MLPVPEPDQATRVIRFGVFEVDLHTTELRKQGVRIRLPLQSFRVLEALLLQPGELVTRKKLKEKLWPADSFGDFEHGLNAAVNRVRDALGDSSDNPRFVETLPRRGYRFLAPINEAAQSEVRASLLSQSPEFADSIAVFPFENAGRDPDKEYLSDGITETIINSLARLRRLRVVPRTTMFRYRDRAADPIQAGRELRARAVLTGRVAERGDQLIVDAELVDTVQESQLWGEKYTRSVSDILVIQEEIASEVSKRLGLQLSDEENRCLTRRPTQNREAYHLSVKGWYYANKWTPEGLDKGLLYTRQAIEADPAFVEPYAVLAYVYSMLGHFGILAPGDAFPNAKAAALRALEIDETFAGVHFSLGVVHLLYDWDWPGAETEIQRGLELAPNDGGGHFAYGEWLTAMGRFGEAVEEMERAHDLDPLSSPISANLASAYSFIRQYDRALEQIRKTVELDPSFIAAQGLLAVLLSRAGYFDNAVAAAEKYLSLPGSDLRGKSILGAVYAIAGREEEAMRIAGELENQPQLRKLTSGLPHIYGVLGDRDRALKWLEEAYHARVSNLVFICRAPELESLHGDPRFEELLRRIGLPAWPIHSNRNRC